MRFRTRRRGCGHSSLLSPAAHANGHGYRDVVLPDGRDGERYRLLVPRDVSPLNL